MKKIISVFTFVCLYIYIDAQDTLVLKNNNRLPAVISEITPLTIKYKKAVNADGPDYIANKSDRHKAKKMKQRKVWTGFGIGLCAAVIFVAIITQ